MFFASDHEPALPGRQRGLAAIVVDVDLEQVAKRLGVAYVVEGSVRKAGNRVRISGWEEWTLGDDGLIADSQGHYDQAEYDRQIEHGVDEARGAA